MEEYSRDKEDIIFIPKLYHAGRETFFETAESLNDAFQTVALFSHNPGITEFVNMLTDEAKLDNMPTCGIFAVRLHSSSWKNFRKTKKEFLFFDYPKNV